MTLPFKVSILPIVLLFLLAFGVPATAQLPGGIGERPEHSGTTDPSNASLDSPEAIREMVSQLTDEQVRQLLLSRLDAAAAPAEDAEVRTSFISAVRSLVVGVPVSALDALSKVPQLVPIEARAAQQFWSERGREGSLGFIALVFGAILIGSIAAWIVDRFAAPWRRRIADRSAHAEILQDRLVALGLRLLLDMSRVAAFYLATAITLEEFSARGDAVLVQAIVTDIVLIPLVVFALGRFVLAPEKSELRLVNADNRTARLLSYNLYGLALLAGTGYTVLAFNALSGVDSSETRIGFWFNLTFFVWLSILIWRTRHGLVQIVQGFEDGLGDSGRLARLYPYYALVSSFLCWAIAEALIANGLVSRVLNGEHLWTLAVFLIGPPLDTLVRAVVRNFAPPMRGDGEGAERAHCAMLRSLVRIGRVLAFASMLFAVSWIWGLSLFTILFEETQIPIVEASARFLSVMIVGYFVWETVRLWFNARLAKEHTPTDDVDLRLDADGEGGQGGSRLSTVLPLISLFVQSVIVAMTLLIAIGNLGIDVTPLLAGAGIVGLAIGFGAQKLVTDVVSGIFFLIDDAFRVGEYVEVDGTLGTVEKISIRSLQLRHHLGPVHTIPYGEVPKITNYSRDWVIMKLEFTVPFDTNINAVKKIFKNIGLEMIQDPNFQADFLQPFKSQGVKDVNEVGIVIRGKYMAKPGKQFTLRKEIYGRVQNAFDKAGIQFARREVRVRVDSPTDTDENIQSTAASAAASEIAFEEASSKASGA